jgi:hypothetical protein
MGRAISAHVGPCCQSRLPRPIRHGEFQIVFEYLLRRIARPLLCHDNGLAASGLCQLWSNVEGSNIHGAPLRLEACKVMKSMLSRRLVRGLGLSPRGPQLTTSDQDCFDAISHPVRTVVPAIPQVTILRPMPISVAWHVVAFNDAVGEALRTRSAATTTLIL